MATAAQLRLAEGKQAVIDLDPVWIGQSVYDLTSVSLVAYIKASAAVPDDDPSVTVITETPGPNGVIEVTDAPGGPAALTVDGSVTPAPGTMFWHLDTRDVCGVAWNIGVQRNGTSGGDTLTTDVVGLLGIYLYRVT